MLSFSLAVTPSVRASRGGAEKGNTSHAKTRSREERQPNLTPDRAERKARSVVAHVAKHLLASSLRVFASTRETVFAYSREKPSNAKRKPAIHPGARPKVIQRDTPRRPISLFTLHSCSSSAGGVSVPDGPRHEHGVGCGGVHRAVGADADSVDDVGPVGVNGFWLLVNLTAVDVAPTPASIERLKHASAFATYVEDRAIRGIRGKAVVGHLQVATRFPRRAAVVARVKLAAAREVEHRASRGVRG